MKKLVLATLLCAGSFASAANICFNGDEATAIKFAGGMNGFRHINYSFNIIDLINQGVKAEEKSYGTKTFITVYDGSKSHLKTTCVLINGQQYGEDTCQICIVKY
ncbi:MAG: hypothetical protein JNM24_12640 [Bdellovibrionaceae bacterium]|nr:hypothetical protein [Pseudobdellovibrionaceae bacterium]